MLLRLATVLALAFSELDIRRHFHLKPNCPGFQDSQVSENRASPISRGRTKLVATRSRTQSILLAAWWVAAKSSSESPS